MIHHVASKGITYKDNFEEHLLVNLHKLLVPFLDICGLLAGVRLVILSLGGVVSVVLAPLNHFAQNCVVDL